MPACCQPPVTGMRRLADPADCQGWPAPTLTPLGPRARTGSGWLAALPGRTIQQLSPTPVSTSIGTAYQAIVRISGHQRVTPLGGMTANVQLAS